MNLHLIAGPIVAAVNPWVNAQHLAASNSYTTAPDGERTPGAPTSTSVQVQMQALAFDELKQVNGLNIQGEKRALYVNGEIKGVARQDGRGGDLFVMPDGTTWLVVLVLENWAATGGWTKVAVVRQKASA